MGWLHIVLRGVAVDDGYEILLYFFVFEKDDLI